MGHTQIKTEHAGAKDSSRKTGYWGKRAWAKRISRKRRRVTDRLAAQTS